MSISKNFVIDETSSDDQYLYIDCPGRGTIAIKLDDEGIVVDIFSPFVKDEAVASTYATYQELSDDA